MKIKHVLSVCAVFLITSIATATPIYNFKAFNASGQFITINGLDLAVEVSAEGQRAVFTFINSSTFANAIAPAITDIYFQDGDLLGISTVAWGTQKKVKFGVGATPADLPNGNAVNFHVTSPSEHFSADSEPSVMQNGVSTGEWLIVKFNLKNNGTVPNVISQLNSGKIKIGMHVQGFDGAVSSYSTINVIPEPATMALLGLGGLLLRRRK